MFAIGIQLATYLRYFLLFTTTLLFDQLTKYVAYTHCKTELVVNSFLSLSLTMNRGITWGLFNSANETVFMGVSAVVVVLCLGFVVFTFCRLEKGHTVVAETLIVAGGVANIVDRILYRGVVDFIVLHVGTWSWPAFNLADAAIVTGVIWLGVTCFYK